MGASSTISFSGSTGCPLDTCGSRDDPLTCHTNLFLSISALPWLADKLASVILVI